MIKLIAFDWNGTLLADTKHCYTSTNHTFNSIGIESISWQQYRETFTIPILDFYAANGADREYILANISTFTMTFHNHYENLAVKARTRKGTRAILTYLQDRKIDRVIFSNHNVAAITKQLERLGIKELIPHVLAHIDRADNVEKRNKGQKLAQFIKEHKYLAREVVIVGDTEEEIHIGKELQATTIAITGGNHTARKLLAAKPDYLIHNLHALQHIINKLFPT